MKICYERFSTDMQDEQRQRYTFKVNFPDEDLKIFTEKAVSGDTDPMERPELNKAVDYCAANGVPLVMTDIDRLCRKAWMTERWIEEVIEKRNIEFIVINDPKAMEDPFVRQIKASLGQDEKRKLKERTRAKMSQIKSTIQEVGYYVTKEGRKISKLGIHGNMDKARKLAGMKAKENAERHAIKISLLVKDALNNCDSYLSMARYLTARNVATPRGGNWSAASVKNVINRLNLN